MSHPARNTLAPPDYDGHFVMIPLTQGKFAIVDEADAEVVLTCGKWQVQGTSRPFYAKRAEDGRTILMHSVITGGRKWADHINRNGLDNRRINLRPASAPQNLANKAPTSSNTSGYKGVSWHRLARKWRAGIRVNGHTRHLGLFADPVDAARAYNQAAAAAYGEFAWLNPLSGPMPAPPARPPAPPPSAPALPSGPVDYSLAARVAQVVMEFPLARHLDRYVAWRVRVRTTQMRPVLRYLVEKGWLEVVREQGRVVSCYYTATEAGRDGFAALLAGAEDCA